MAVSGLGSGIGATLHDGTTTYSDILSVNLPGMTCGETDISSASSASQCSESLPGLIDAGFLICVLRYGTTLGVAAETEMAALSTLHLARTITEWTLTIPGDSTWVCKGFLAKLGNTVHYKGGVQQQVVVKLTGVPAWTAAT